MMTLRFWRSMLVNQVRMVVAELVAEVMFAFRFIIYARLTHDVQAVLDGKYPACARDDCQQDHDALPERLLQRIYPGKEQDAADQPQRECSEDRPNHAARAAKKRCAAQHDNCDRLQRVNCARIRVS